MTKGDKLNNSFNKTYEIDVDDVGTVPECTEVEKQRNLYSTPFQTEPVYESPLNMGVIPTMVAQQRESEQRQGRRSKTNDIYESTNDETLPNGRSYTGYSYCRNTDVVSPRSSQQPCLTYDNLVSTTQGEHEYVESFRNSRFSENAVYSDSTQASKKAFTIEGVRDAKTGAPKRYPHGNHGQQRATCIQVFTLLLSIMAFVIGTFALLVALKTIKLNDIKKNDSPTLGQQTGSNQESGPGSNQGSSNESSSKHESSKYKELLDKMEQQVASSQQNYTNLMEQYNQIKKQVASSEQNYNNLTAKYNEMIKQFNTKLNKVNDASQKLGRKVENINSTFSLKLKNVNWNVSSLSRDLDEVNTELRSVNTFSQQLRNTVEDMNSTFATKIRNVSKQMGPRGFNGSQGLQGPQGAQGVGNLSACIVRELSNPATLGDVDSANIQKSEVSYEQRPGYKIISAVCATRQHAGAIQTVLSREGNKYTCTCAGPSTYSSFVPIKVNGKKEMVCVIIFWECPELT